MRTLIILTLAVSLTGCSWLRTRRPMFGGSQTLNVTSCEQKGDTLHVTVQEPCGPQVACAPGKVCLPGKACGPVAGGSVGCRKCLTLGWLRIPIPFPKIERVPVCQQVVPGCAPNGCNPSAIPVLPPAGEQAVPVPVIPAPKEAVTTQMEDRTRQLEDQVRRLRRVLQQQQTVINSTPEADTTRPQTPILPPPQRWGPEDGVPAFTQSPIEQLSGSSTQRSANAEPWPYSPQNPHRRAVR